MLTYAAERTVKAHANVVWRVITDHDVFTAFAPGIAKAETIEGEKLGLVRRMHHKSGKIWLEKCVAWDEGKSFTMELDTGDYVLPVTKIFRTWTMEEGPKNVTIRLQFDYLPKYGPVGLLLDRFHIFPLLTEYARKFIENFVSEIYAGEWDFHVTAATILESKGSDIISMHPDMTVFEGDKLLNRQRIGSAVVLDADGKLVGVFSERDVVNGLAEFGAEILEQPVAKVMTHDVIVGHPSDTLQELMSCMTDRCIRHIPIVDAERLTGIVSIGDVVKARMEELETESAAMHDYIENRRWRELAFKIGRAAATEELSDGRSSAGSSGSNLHRALKP